MSISHPISDAALDADIAIVAKKGRGKSYTARGLVERLLAAGRQVVVLDPLSTWWGLKAAGTGAGAGPGFPVPVIGGPHSDVPLDPEHLPDQARALAAHLVATRGSAVVDLGDLRKGALVRFAEVLLAELYTTNRAPLWLVLEEADVLAPQQPMPDTTRVLGEVDRIARRGRNFGFRLISITQRPAKLNKDVLTQLSTLVALGLTSPQDRKAVEDWVAGVLDKAKAAEFAGALAGLGVGEGYVWTPDRASLERVTFPRNRTLDTSATPQAGATAPKVRAVKADVAGLREAMSISAPSKEAAKRDTAPAERPESAEEIAAAERRGYERGVKDGHIAERDRVHREVAMALQGLAETMLTGVPDDDGSQPARTREKSSPAAKNRDQAPAPAKKHHDTSAPEQVAETSLNSAARKMREILDTNPPVRRSWAQVATLAGLKARGGHFNAGRKGLLDAGLVVEDGGLVAIGEPSPGAAAAVVDPAALVETWAKALGGAAARILRALAARGGEATRATIAADLGLKPAGGHWNAAWKQLRDNGFVTIAGDVASLTALFRPAPVS